MWATAIDTAASTTAAVDTTVRPRRRGVFLATVDLRNGSPSRGREVGAVLAADTAGRVAHHAEHSLAADGLLFANDFRAGRTYRFDLRTPGEPSLLGAFTTAGPLGFPHSFVRLAGGNVLATYQEDASGHPPGGLAELRRDGTMVDRVVTTSFSMTTRAGVHVQIWRLSDLELLHTLPLPEAPAHEAHRVRPDTGGNAVEEHDEMHHLLPGEPRLLADGRTVMLGTFTCGLYRVTGLDGRAPRIAFAHAFRGRDCAVPVRVGRWWVQTVSALHALVALDVSDPAHPEKSRTSRSASR